MDKVLPGGQAYTTLRRPKEINVVFEVVLPDFVQR